MMENEQRNTRCPNCGKELKLNETGRIGWCSVHKTWYAVIPGAEGEAAAKMAEEARLKEQAHILEEQERLGKEREAQQQQHVATLRKVALVAAAVLLVAVAVIFFIVKPGMTYHSAEDAFAANDYEKALEVFIGLGTYRDSSEKATLCAALIDLEGNDYSGAIDKLDMLMGAGKGDSAALIRDNLLPILSNWQKSGISPEAMLQLLTRKDSIDPEQRLDYDVLTVQTHAALLETDVIQYTVLDVDADGHEELLVLNSDCSLSGYKMLPDRNELFRVDSSIASDCLIGFGDQLLEGDPDHALRCYLEAYRLLPDEEQKQRVIKAYRLNASRYEAAGDTDTAISNARSAMETGGGAEDFIFFYQTVLRCVKGNRDKASAVQEWDAFMMREANTLGRFNATELAKADAGKLRLIYADELAAKSDPECLACLTDAISYGVDAAPIIRDAIGYFSPGLTKTKLRLMLGECTPLDEEAQMEKLSADACTALNDWRGFGMTGDDTLSLLSICRERAIDISGVNKQAIYREAALEASNMQMKQTEFVDWDADGNEELLAITEGDSLVLFALDGQWTRKINYEIGLLDVSFIVHSADIPMVIVTSALSDGLAVYGYQDGKLGRLLKESGIEHCRINENNVTYERALPGSIARSETYAYDISASVNVPLRTGIEWRKNDYPYPATAAAAIRRWVEAGAYQIPEEKSLLTANALSARGFGQDITLPTPATISEISVEPYAIFDDATLLELSYSTVSGADFICYAAAVKEDGAWKMAGLSARFSTDAVQGTAMLAEPLLALNETITAPSPAKEKAVNYRVLLPKAATLTLLWQAGEKKESRTAFTVALYDENDLTKAIISYDLALNPGQQMSYPLPLTAGIYYVSVTAKTSAAVQYTISLKAEENARIESESNNTSDEADQVELNAAYTAGLLNSADVDFFVFELTEPGKVSVTLNGNDEGKKQNRYQLTVYDAASGAVLTDTAMPGNVKKFRTPNLYLNAGKYFVRLGKGAYYSATVYQITADYVPMGLQELERNDSPDFATALPVNAAAVGSFGKTGDVDYYVFTLDSAALIQPKLSFTPLETTSKTYVLTLLNGSQQLMKVNIGGKESQKVITPFALPAGKYTVKLENPNFTAQDYTLTIVAQSVVSAEVEPNDALADATVLPFDTFITGILSHAEDVDLYKLTVTESVTATLKLSFAKQSSSDTIFSISLEQNGKTAWKTNVKGSDGDVEQALRFAPGEYYIRVKPSTWSGIPYTISAVAQ